MQSFLDAFERVAIRSRAALREHEFDAKIGEWHDSAVLKVQKRTWRGGLETGDASEVGVFFSVWIEERSLKLDRVFYNIHALRLRRWDGYRLQSREFAAAFRAEFRRVAGAWPNVSVAHGPQTLMQGWIELRRETLEDDVIDLVRLFMPLAGVVDRLLDSRKAA